MPIRRDWGTRVRNRSRPVKFCVPWVARKSDGRRPMPVLPAGTAANVLVRPGRLAPVRSAEPAIVLVRLEVALRPEQRIPLEIVQGDEPVHGANPGAESE